MHLHAEHTLFFKRHKPLWHVASSLMLAICILVLNTGMGMEFSLVGSFIGLALLVVAYTRGHKRIEAAFAWALVVVVIAILSGAFLSLELELFYETAARIMCGVTWILWLGT